MIQCVFCHGEGISSLNQLNIPHKKSGRSRYSLKIFQDFLLVINRFLVNGFKDL